MKEVMEGIINFEEFYYSVDAAAIVVSKVVGELWQEGEGIEAVSRSLVVVGELWQEGEGIEAVSKPLDFDAGASFFTAVVMKLAEEGFSFYFTAVLDVAG